MTNSTRKRVLLRGVRSVAALGLGAAASALVSPDFREFVGDGVLGVAVLGLVPPALLMLDKWRRELKAPDDPARSEALR